MIAPPGPVAVSWIWTFAPLLATKIGDAKLLFAAVSSVQVDCVSFVSVVQWSRSNVAVTKGQSVKEGERLLSIEAMKMETAVYSPRASKVKEVLVKPGSGVTAGDLLVVLEG